ncbi:MAG: glycosyl hydrolase family 8 [Streptococcus sp.]
MSNGKAKDEDHNATDGDLYIAYALLKAAQQWPKQAKRLPVSSQSDFRRYSRTQLQ